MDTSKHFLTFLKTLQTSDNVELLECIERGFRHVMAEGMTLGNIYAHQIGMHPTPVGGMMGSEVPAPADMITEDSEKDMERSKEEVAKDHKMDPDDDDFEINYGCKVVPECVSLESNEQLKHWSEQDQTERNTYAKYVKDELKGNWENAGKIWAKLKNRSSDDVFGDDARLKEFMNTKFNFDEFDKEDWHRYWVLSQHADKYIEFQKHALEIIKKYLGSDHINYKYLCDRISCKETGTQKYNTQDGCNKRV